MPRRNSKGHRRPEPPMPDNPRYSAFWLRGGYLTTPAPDFESDVAPEDTRKRIPHFYGVETIDGNVTVHRFQSAGDVALWVAAGEPGQRERAHAHDRIIKAARAADDWPAEDQVDDDETRRSIHDLNEQVLDRHRQTRQDGSGGSEG